MREMTSISLHMRRYLRSLGGVFLSLLFTVNWLPAQEPQASPEQTRARVVELLQNYSWHYFEPQIKEQARKDLQAMGTNAIPYLVEILGYRQATMGQWYAAAYQKMPKSVTDKGDQAAVFEQMGYSVPNLLQAMTNKKQAVPYLMKLVADDRTDVRYRGLEMLQSLIEGTEKELLPVFIDRMQHEEESNLGVATYVVGLYCKNEPVVRQLMEEALSSTNERVRLQAAAALLKVDDKHVKAMETVHGLFTSTNTTVKGSAARLYYLQTKNAEAVVPVYLSLLSSTNSNTQVMGLANLGAMESKAKTAVPSIVSLMYVTNRQVGVAARQALGRIDPEKLKELPVSPAHK